MLIITEILIGSGSTKGSSTMGIINPDPGNIISSSTALLTSIAILITNEDISELKILYTKLRDQINVITLLYEKTFENSMVDKKIDENEAEALRKVYNHYLDKRKEILKTTTFEVKVIFVDVISKDIFSQ